MFWSKEQECISRDELKKLQLFRLKETIKRVYNNVPFYRKRLDSIGLSPENISSLDDLKEIPFTTKDDIREHYPYGLFAEPMKKIVRIHASSGTTGKPTVVGYTKNDLNTWSELVARVIVEAGGNEDDVAQVAFGYGLFTGAFGLHYGLEKIGAAVVPCSSGNTEKQIMLMKDFGTTLLVSTPSYALYMSEVAQELNIKRENLKLRLGLFGAEGSTEEMRNELEQRWGIVATENYGLSEIIGPGVSGECIYKQGMHIAEDHFIPEIINPDTGEVLNWGEKGELVITTITKEGFPLLRYRTKDITWLTDEPCQCGRTLARMAKVQGRSDDMLIIKGVNVFPSQIESVLIGLEHIGPHYQIVVRKKGFVDTLEVLVELIDGSMLEKFSELEKLEHTIRHKLHTILGLDAKVRLVEPKTIERSMGKAKRVIDLRNS
ncbi:phenylacetate--CoA ligase family protein [Petroclostridium xylanilyticum]|jgi:phenylacetate-CoA ligase|uniref:phenylacetate--CoA ligase family protein n=1 Tax=Petroclostridium xylanilyticum TaxID=1792311 RepID=UPI000B98E6E1|nr:phenylacetate--CoA ligase [Petroclostridium xylanilyticum]